MSENNNDLNNLERRTSGTMLYISLLEIFTKFRMFEQPKKGVEVVCGTLEIFIKKVIEQSPETNQNETKKLFLTGLKELSFRLEENY